MSCHRDMTSRHGRRVLAGGIVSDMLFDTMNPPGVMGESAGYDSEALVEHAVPTLDEGASR